MSEKQQVTIYKIDQKYVSDLLKLPANSSKDTLLDAIISSVEDQRKKLKYIPLSVQTIKEFHIKLYFGRIANEWTWPDFFNGKIDPNNDDAKTFINNNKMYWPNMVCFFHRKDSIYAVCAGLGHHYINDFTEEHFGMSVLEKISPKDNISFSMLKNRSVIGDVALNSRVFRDKRRVWSEDVLGKIYGGANFSINELSISDKTVKDLLLHSSDDKQKNSINISASNGIKFNRKFTITEVATLINYIDGLPKEQFSFSLIRSISKSKNELLIENLDNHLSKQIYSLIKSFSKNTGSAFTFFEFAHKNSIEYYNSTNISIIRNGKEITSYESPYGLNGKEVLRDIFNNDKKYLNKKIENTNISKKDDLEKWKSILSKYRISVLNDSDIVIESNLLKFLFGEITYDNKKYFFLDEKWFRTADSFVSKLDEDTAKLINSTRESELDFGQEWGEEIPEDKEEGENFYLERLQDKAFADQYVLHRIIPDDIKIEICDILQFDENTTYLCHLKPGFQGEMRTLAAQIIHATKLLIDYHQGGDEKIIKSYYDKAVNYRGNTPYKNKAKENFEVDGYEEFKKLFSADRDFVFVAAICDENRDIFGDLSQFDSIIAKLAIFDLVNYMSSLTTTRFKFKIMQF